MSLKTYDEMRKIDVSKYTEKRDKIDYLNWAKCIDLLHEHGAEKVYFEPLINTDGSSLFKTDKIFTDKNGGVNQCYEVGVKVVVDDEEWIFRGPLMNGSNPVKDNSLSQQRVWNCQTRLFVKCIAIHTGLGFNLWLKEESSDFSNSFEDDIWKHNIVKIYERSGQHVTALMDKGMSKSEIAEKLGTDEKGLDAKFQQYKEMDRFEHSLIKMINELKK